MTNEQIEQAAIDQFITALLSSTEKDFSKRLAACIESSGVDENILDNRECQEKLHEELVKRNNNKFHALTTKQIMLWNINSHALDSITATTAEDKIKEVKLRDEISDLQDKLRDQIESLYKDIYKDQAIIDATKDVAFQAMTPEQRLKNKRK